MAAKRRKPAASKKPRARRHKIPVREFVGFVPGKKTRWIPDTFLIQKEPAFCLSPHPMIAYIEED